MLQRGRKLVVVDDRTVSMKAPCGLNKAEKKLFDDMIASVDHRHFVKSDTPLLVSYVQASIMARKAARSPLQIVMFERAVKVQIMLARSLRLSPRTRIDGRKAGRLQPDVLNPPWED